MRRKAFRNWMCLLAAPKKPKPVLIQPLLLLLCHINLCICWTNTYLCRSFLIPGYLSVWHVYRRTTKTGHYKPHQTLRSHSTSDFQMLPFTYSVLWFVCDYFPKLSHIILIVCCVCVPVPAPFFSAIIFNLNFFDWILFISSRRIINATHTDDANLPNCVQVVFRFNLHNTCARYLALASMIFSFLFCLLHSPVSLIKCFALN